LEMP